MTFLSYTLPDWTDEDRHREDMWQRLRALRVLDDTEAPEVYGRRRLGSMLDHPYVRAQVEERLAKNWDAYDTIDDVSHRLLVWIFEEALGEIGPQGRILDFGSGAGSLVNFHKDYGELENPVVAVDLVDPGCEWPSNVTFVQSDLHAFQAAEHGAADGFDLALSLHVFEHTPDPAPLVAKMRSLLRPGGKALIAVPDGRGLHDLLQHQWGGQDCDHINSYTEDGFRALLEGGGFRVLQHTSWPAHFSIMYGGVTLPDGRTLGELLDATAKAFDHVHGGTSLSCYGWLYVCEA